jgi:hypothetical protein
MFVIKKKVLVREREVKSGVVKVEENPVKSGVHMGVNIGGMRAPNKVSVRVRVAPSSVFFCLLHFIVPPPPRYLFLHIAYI